MDIDCLHGHAADDVSALALKDVLEEVFCIGSRFLHSVNLQSYFARASLPFADSVSSSPYFLIA